MDRIFQRVWDRYGPAYSWAICIVVYLTGLSVHLAFPLIIVAFEGADRYLAATVITCVALLVRVYLMVLPGSEPLRLIERWAAGQKVDPMEVLRATTLQEEDNSPGARHRCGLGAVRRGHRRHDDRRVRLALGAVRRCRCRVWSGHRTVRCAQLQ